MLVLTVNIYQALTDFLQQLQRGGVSVDPVAAAISHNLPPQNDDIVVIIQVSLAQGSKRPGSISSLKGSLNERPIAALPNDLCSHPLAQHSIECINDD